MVTMQSVKNSVMSSVGMARKPLDVNLLKTLCASLLCDVSASDRKVMLQRLDTLRRADDVWHLRTALFDTIARAHGESAARERLVKLDAQLK